MKKLLVLLSLLTIGFILQKCQTTTDTDSVDNQENTIENGLDVSNRSFLDILVKNGGKIVTQDEIETRDLVVCENGNPGCSEKVHFSFNDLVMPGTCDHFYGTGYVQFCEGTLVLTNFYAKECPRIKKWWDYLYDTSDSGLDFAIDSFNYYASRIFEDRIAKMILQSLNLHCPNGMMSGEYYTPTCFRYCVWKEYIGKPGDKYVLIEMHYEKKRCGDNCCLRKRTLCLNDSGEIEEQNVSFEQKGAQICDGYQEPCNKGRLLTTDCEHPCGAPD